MIKSQGFDINSTKNHNKSQASKPKGTSAKYPDNTKVYQKFSGNDQEKVQLCMKTQLRSKFKTSILIN